MFQNSEQLKIVNAQEHSMHLPIPPVLGGVNQASMG